jgi:cytidine deaminase
MRKTSSSEEAPLMKAASSAMKLAYSPYSKVKVGAAVLTEDGRIYVGCNVENASYGLSVCAERTAAFKAVSEGHRRVRMIAVTSNMEGIAYPCGACRQVLMEFGPRMIVVLFDGKGEIERYSLDELLAHPFRL